jgi:hypothetical protein
VTQTVGKVKLIMSVVQQPVMLIEQAVLATERAAEASYREVHTQLSSKTRRPVAFHHASASTIG